MAKKKPLVERIDEALAGGRLSIWNLAALLWPPDEHPRAWRHSSRGGPCAWTRTLGAALRRGAFYVEMGIGPGRVVHPRRKKT